MPTLTHTHRRFAAPLASGLKIVGSYSFEIRTDTSLQ